MAEQRARIKCPICPPDVMCEHDQDERYSLAELNDLQTEAEDRAAPATADERGNKRRSGKKKLDEAMLAEAIGYVMADPRGRRFVYWVLAAAEIWRAGGVIGPHPEFVLALREGERAVGLKVFDAVCAHDRDAFATMLKERADHVA